MFTLTRYPPYRQGLQQIGELRNATLDVGFLLAPVEDESLELEHVLSIAFVAALPEDHPLIAEMAIRVTGI